MKKEITPRFVKDFLVSGEEFELKFDPQKKLYFTFPQPEDNSRYYQSNDYISHTDSNTGITSFLYQAVKKIMLQKKVRKIYRHTRQHGSLLDIGAGTGEFLRVAKNKGWQVNGVEPNAKARNIAQTKGIKLFKSLNQIEDKRFDVITLWHVLEHIPNLYETISKINTHLKPNGIVIIAVPNYKSYDAQYYRQFWAAYDVPRHLWHFSQDSIKEIVTQKWELIKINPMIFDSFYVSLLSEKYKTGKSNFIKAFYIGLKSNIKALKTNEYSSLVYTFKKHKKTA